jgi:uncharacterized repeat protein (TIGR01451 family)
MAHFESGARERLKVIEGGQMIANASPAESAYASSVRLGRRRRRALPAIVALALGLGALALAPSSGLASAGTEPCLQPSPAKKLCLSVTDSPDPVAYSVFDGNSTWLQYTADLSNPSRSKLARVHLTERLPKGTTFVSADPSAGTCAQRGRRVACKLGSLARGASATVDVVVTAPTALDPDPADTTLTNKVVATFRKGAKGSAKAHGKRARVKQVETTTVSKSAGQTYVPSGQTGKVGTDPDQAQYANSSIPNASTGVLASLEVEAADDFCHYGKVEIDGKWYVCRAGGFVQASVTDAVTGEPYANPEDPLVFHLAWDGSLVSPKQTVSNFVVFYQSTEDAPIEVFCARCNKDNSNLPCLKNITKLDDGGFAVDLVKQDNGRMR